MERHRLAMLLFISSEAIFFGALIVTFLTHRDGPGSEAARLFDVPLIALFSLALFSSSATIEFAGRRMHRDDLKGMRLWLGATLALGLIFLGGQAFEYLELLSHGVTPSVGIFPSAFYTLTGFHGLHVLGGLFAMAVLGSVSSTPGFTRQARPAVESVTLYWHFVDGVWVVVFAVVYLWTVFTT